ncbi:hypothetical protein R1T16_10610 [Flavobacterium sp. DG1-102-2]|uniref:hypothetical protein n=1 Tax=Flavobacterium sp. DG1-102-2 TaxID=3081663 RepID=UPI002948D6D3|nr:hypothetical protein [Flavobacterium sp. DG1-102-2]MDV6168878.1 hypothetical protein [Flavobacterium sp. DG1-102-2]
MKRILQNALPFLLMLPLLFTSSSCSPDGDNERTALASIVDISYKIVVDRSVISKITYKDPTGQMIAANEQYQSLLTWQKAQSVEMPFEALMNVDFTGTANTEVHYDLYIYLDGVQARHQEGVVPAEGSASISYGFSVTK